MGYSRATYMKFVACSGEDMPTLCAGLREVFDYFGGVPEHVLFDNTKAVVIRRDAYGEGLHRWNRELRELAESCGFKEASIMSRLGEHLVHTATGPCLTMPTQSPYTVAKHRQARRPKQEFEPNQRARSSCPTMPARPSPGCGCARARQDASPATVPLPGAPDESGWWPTSSDSPERSRQRYRQLHCRPEMPM